MCGPSEPLRWPLRYCPTGRSFGNVLSRNKIMVLFRLAGATSFLSAAIHDTLCSRACQLFFRPGAALRRSLARRCWSAIA